MSMTKLLKSMKGTWDTAKEGQIGVPSGKYQMQLQALTLTATSAGDKLMVKREHLIIDGEHDGEVAYDNLVLTEFGQAQLAEFIRKCGFEVPDDPEELPEVLTAISEQAPQYVATVTSRDGFNNVRIDRMLEEGEEVETDEEGAEEEAEQEGIDVGSRVTWEYKGETLAGEVTELLDDGIRVKRDDNGRITKVNDGDYYEEEAEEAEEAEETEDGASDEVFEQLVAFAESMSIEEAADAEDLPALVEVLGAYDWDADQLAPEEVELLESVEIAVTKPKPKAKPKAKAKAKPAAGKKK